MKNRYPSDIDLGKNMGDTGRRKFLTLCLGGLAAAAAGGALYPVLRYLSPRSGREANAKVSIPENVVPSEGARFFEFAGSAAVLIRTKKGEYAALSAVCTHLGCIVQWEKDKQRFLCPCHAGLYAADGTVLSGPPPKPLARLPLKVEAGVITVG